MGPKSVDLPFSEATTCGYECRSFAQQIREPLDLRQSDSPLSGFRETTVWFRFHGGRLMMRRWKGDVHLHNAMRHNKGSRKIRERRSSKVNKGDTITELKTKWNPGAPGAEFFSTRAAECCGVPRGLTRHDPTEGREEFRRVCAAPQTYIMFIWILLGYCPYVGFWDTAIMTRGCYQRPIPFVSLWRPGGKFPGTKWRPS